MATNPETPPAGSRSTAQGMRRDNAPTTVTGSRGHIGFVVAGSLATGLVAALLLVFVPFIPAEERAVTGAVLLGFALGWAMLAVLSVRFTDQPQRWAAVPALFMGVSGLLLLAFPSPVHEVLDWVWPLALLVLAIWTFVQARRQLHSWSRPWLIYPVTVVMALAAVGGGFETVSEALDAKAYPMAGQLIDVGGHSLHLSCTGSGAPTVVLEPGAGGMSSSLGWITPAVAPNTRVCVYDRAGRGWSEPAAAPQDATQIATDLHTLLQRAHVPGPYVLAGHSFGGLYVLTYAARYPDQVAGMVLIDSTAPEPASASSQTATVHGNGSYDGLGRVAALVSSSARLGLARFVDQFISGALPARSSEEVRAGTSTAADVRSIIDEYLEAGSSTREAGSLTDFGNKPLVVLTAGSGHDAAWQAKQNALAKLSTNSDHRVAAGAVHQALVDDERFAAITTQAILEDVAAVRSGGQLAH